MGSSSLSTCPCNATAGNFVHALSGTQGNKDMANTAITKQLITFFFFKAVLRSNKMSVLVSVVVADCVCFHKLVFIHS